MIHRSFMFCAWVLMAFVLADCGGCLSQRPLAFTEPTGADEDADGGQTPDTPPEDADGGLVEPPPPTNNDGGSIEPPPPQSDAGSPPEPECASDADCALGELCLQGTCAEGCTGGRDCPDDRPYCDESIEPNGRCVLCAEDDHCEGEAVCVNHECRTDCSFGAACPDGQQCHPDTGVCVNCLDDDQCDTGEICEDNTCEEGCRDDRDCGEDICVEGQCIDGCLADEECPLGTLCENYECILGCGGDDSRCPEDESCIDGLCAEVCQSSDECEPGRTCYDGSCVEGCQNDDECPDWWGATHCETSTTPGTCVECTEDSHCVIPNQVCDLSSNLCRIGGCETDQDCAFMFGVCDQSDGMCVDCLGNDNCDDDEVCTDERLCEEVPTIVGICGECESSADCGDGNYCIQYNLGWGRSDQGCGLDCSSGDDVCPQGYSCSFVGGEAVEGKQCVPSNSVHEERSCKAFRDLINGQECQDTRWCGLFNADDAICSGYGSTAYQCSLFCEGDTDCPENFFCETVAESGETSPAPRCAPNP